MNYKAVREVQTYMPRTCLVCGSAEREGIDRALIAGEPLRNIAIRVSISPAASLRHKSHVAQSIVTANERREELLGDNLHEEMRRVQRKAWELLAKTEAEGDHRGAIVALREVRECLRSLGEMLSLATAEAAGPLTGWSNDELEEELGKRGVKLTNIFIKFERVKDGKPCDCPCCSAARKEESA
jgi:hypothetical protein